MTKTWHERVLERLQALEAQDEADKQWFHDLCRYLSNAQADRDGEKLTRDGGEATKLYKGEPVFSFSVREGKTIVVPIGQKSESYCDREQALDRVADLLAQAARDPEWGKQVHDRVAGQPTKPLYPV
jgi:hypothetical protein